MVDSSVYDQRTSERPSTEEERQAYNDGEERQRQQADLHQEEEEATES